MLLEKTQAKKVGTAVSIHNTVEISPHTLSSRAATLCRQSNQQRGSSSLLSKGRSRYRLPSTKRKRRDHKSRRASESMVRTAYPTRLLFILIIHPTWVQQQTPRRSSRFVPWSSRIALQGGSSGLRRLHRPQCNTAPTSMQCCTALDAMLHRSLVCHDFDRFP